MKKSKDEILNAIREHGGDVPDDFIIGLLEDISDSFDDPTDELNSLRAQVEELTKNNNTNEELTKNYNKLQEDYNNLRKSYADRFTIKSDDKKEEDKQTIEEKTEDDTFNSIFDD